MLVIACISVLIFAVFLASFIKLPNKPAYFLFIYLIIYAEIGFIAQLSHFVKQLNNPIFFLGLQIFFLVIVYFVWTRKNKPPLFTPFSDFRLIFNRQRMINFVKSWPDVSILFFVVAASLVLTAVINYVVPPNNNDSISTHVSRIGFWLHQGSFAHWSTPKIWQIVYPVNAQVQMLWTILFSGSDHFVGFVQWFAQAAAMICVFGIARLLKASRPQAALAALVLAALPIIQLQSTTTQNDLVAGALFAISFYFFFLAIQENRNILFVISGLALGVGIGTKQTIIFLLPGFGLAILMVWLIFKRTTFNKIFVFASSVLVSFLLIGSVIFFINQRAYQNPFGPKSAVSHATQGLSNASDHLLLNSFRFLYQMADPIGLPERFAAAGIDIKASLAGPVFNALNIPIESDIATAPGHPFSFTMKHYLQEDEAWFGPIGFLILIPAVILGLIFGIKRKEPIRISIFLVAFGFLICDVLFRPGWDPFQGRYFIPVVAVAAPLLALWVSPGWWRRLIGLFIVLVSIVVLYKTTFSNPAKPLRSMENLYPPNPKLEVIWGLDRMEKITLQSGGTTFLCRMVDEVIPQDAIVGIATTETYYQEYCFFGEHFTRTLVPVYPSDRIEDEEWLRNDQHIDFLLVKETDEYPPFIPDNYFKRDKKGNWAIYEWSREN
ncbi:MAG: hypothetical protein CL609_16710 [Anaerolineaceae bacterium]|nr:hypothetical protein [Anaerolineaceae bacterium]